MKRCFVVVLFLFLFLSVLLLLRVVDLRLSCDKLVKARVREIHKRLVIKLCAKIRCRN